MLIGRKIVDLEYGLDADGDSELYYLVLDNGIKIGIARVYEDGKVIEEDRIPIMEGVKAACELLGLDPIYVANEGKLVAVVEPSDADKVLAQMKQNGYGREAAIIGEVTAKHLGRVIMKTKLGPSRIVDMLSGELLPRIC